MLNEMLREANDVFSYEENIGLAYEVHRFSLLEEVNKEMHKLDNIHALIGNNPLSMMENNHKNHIEFMNSIIKYKQKELFIHTLPWVYKAYGSNGFDYDYFKFELREWIEANQNTC